MSMKFATNVPVEVALEYATRKPVEGQWGPQVMYSLVGGEKMYLAPEVAAQIGARWSERGGPAAARSGKKGISLSRGEVAHTDRRVALTSQNAMSKG